MKIKSKILLIAGSDSSGAGIQADIKTVTAFGLLCNDRSNSCYNSKY